MMNGIQNYLGSNYQPSFQQKGSLRRYGKLAKYVKPEQKPNQPMYVKKKPISVKDFTRLMQSFIYLNERTLNGEGDLVRNKLDRIVDLLMQHQSCDTKRVGHEGIIDDIKKILAS